MPSAKADWVCSICAFPALPCWAFTSRRYAAGTDPAAEAVPLPKIDSPEAVDLPELVYEPSAQFPGIHRENSGHLLIASFAHAVFLSLWHDVHGFGIPYLSVISGEMKRKVWACTNVPGTPSLSIAGIWQATHWLPTLPSLWCVCSSRVAVCGPFALAGPWQSRQICSAGFRS